MYGGAPKGNPERDRAMKVCFKCGVEKPLAEFYRHPRMADGHLNKCKDCTKRDVAKNYRRKRRDPKWLEAERRRGREKYHRLYRPENPAVFVTTNQDPAVKQWARRVFKSAVRDGKVVRPERCEECGTSKGPIHGHHDDYTKPLDVRWLCTRCHAAVHWRRDAA